MKYNKIIVSLISLLFSGLFLLSCTKDENEGKTLYVDIELSVGVYACKNGKGGVPDVSNDPFPSRSYKVHVEIGKDGAVKCRETLELQSGIKKVNCRVELFKDQPAEVRAYLTYPFDHIQAFKRLNWNQVYPATDFGETYSWAPALSLCAESRDH